MPAPRADGSGVVLTAATAFAARRRVVGPVRGFLRVGRRALLNKPYKERPGRELPKYETTNQ